MATTTYSQMTPAVSLHDEDVFAVDQPNVQNDETGTMGVSKKVSLAQVAYYAERHAPLKEDKSNKVSSFHTNPDDEHYPSEKLTKDSLDLKEDIANKDVTFPSSPTEGHYPQTRAVKTYVDNGLSDEEDRAKAAEDENAEAAAAAQSTANAALPAATATADYVKKAYALNGGATPTYQMLKAVTWNIDASGHLTLHAWMRDLSGVITADIEDDLVPPLASGTSDGVMPHETFATVEELVTKVAALTGSIIPKGTIQLPTADVTQELLTAFVGGTPAQGWGVKDLDNVTWVYEAEDEEWVPWGDGEIAQATNDDNTDPENPIVGTLGLVKGKNLDGYVFVESDGTLSVVGWSALVTRVTNLENNKVNISDIKNDLTSTDTDKPLSAAQGKALADNLAEHKADTDIHVSETDRENWDGAEQTATEAKEAAAEAQATAEAIAEEKQDALPAGTAGQIMTAPTATGGPPDYIDTVPIENGGTGATTPEAARAALGAMASGDVGFQIMPAAIQDALNQYGFRAPNAHNGLMAWLQGYTKGTRVAGNLEFARDAPFYKHSIAVTSASGTAGSGTVTLVTKDAAAYTTAAQIAAALYATGKDDPGSISTPNYVNGALIAGSTWSSSQTLASPNGTSLASNGGIWSTIIFTDTVSTPAGLDLGVYYNLPNQYMQTPGNGWSGVATYTINDYVQLELSTDGNFSGAVYGNADYLKYQITGTQTKGVDYRADTGYLYTNRLKKPYSTAETLTGEYWIDGKPIYRRVFTGNVVAAANYPSSIQLMSGVSSLINSGGTWQMGGMADYISLGYAFDGEAGPSGITNAAAVLYFDSTSFSARTGTNNNAYKIWVEYTKA